MIDSPNAELTLTLPDGSARRVPYGTLPRDVVAGIGAGLLRAAVAVQLDGNIQDLVTPLRSSGAFRVLTEKDAPALDVLRHSAAHLLATAVRRLRPDAKIGFGPAIDDGFYYDFEVAQPFTPEDLEAFEKEMKKVVGGEIPVRARRGEPRAGAAEVRRRSAQARAALGAGERRGDLRLHRRAVLRPLPRPARARHVAHQALQAAAYGRRILARRRAPSDAAAHLWHRVVHEGRARRVPRAHRGGEEARSPHARGASSISIPPISASARVSFCGTRAVR